MKSIKPKRRGRPPLSGGYSLMVRAGELPENRRYIRAFLSVARAGFIKDLGPTEQDLTTAQLILIDRVICKLGVIRCIEEYIREVGVMKGQNVAPVLQAAYGQYSTSLRLDLIALGIKTKAGEGVIDLPAYIRSVDAAKSQAKARKGGRTAVAGQVEAVGASDHQAAGQTIVQRGASSEDISVKEPPEPMDQGGLSVANGDGQPEGGQDQVTLEREIAELEARKKQLEAGAGGPGERKA
jgi:hypothetical protein